jgi:hypothetical protein
VLRLSSLDNSLHINIATSISTACLVVRLGWQPSNLIIVVLPTQTSHPNNLLPTDTQQPVYLPWGKQLTLLGITCLNVKLSIDQNINRYVYFTQPLNLGLTRSRVGTTQFKWGGVVTLMPPLWAGKPIRAHPQTPAPEM